MREKESERGREKEGERGRKTDREGEGRTEREREGGKQREREGGRYRPLVTQTSGSRRRRENLKHARLADRSKVICTSFALAAVTCPCALETFSKS